MKSPVLVILDGSTHHISEQLKESMERHRLDEDRIESIQAHHWDYWYFPSDAPFDDRELEETCSDEPENVLNNSIYVRNLPEGYATSGIICRDGSWIDPQDFGWRLMSGPSTSNDKALEKWVIKCNEILSENKDEIGVQVIVHC